MALDTSTLPKDDKTNLPIVPAPAPKGSNNVEIPKEVQERSFIDDFEVEQLPEQGKAEETAKGKVDEAKKVEAPKTEETAVEEPEPKTEEVPKVEEKTSVNPLDKILKKPGQKKEETAVQKEGEVVKPIVPKKEPVRRDYTGYSEEDISAFKKMSDEGYKYTTDKLKELKELKEKTYLQHERAYTLSPEYNETAQTAQYASFEERYWNEQLINMDAGKDLIPLTGYGKDGQPVYGQPLKPTKQLEESVRQAMYDASNMAKSLKTKLAEFPTKYKGQIAQELANIENYRKQQFGWVADPTMLDYTMDIGGKEKSLKQIREDVVSMVPAALRNNPLVGVLGDLVIAVQIQKAQLSAYESTKQVEKVKEEETELLEPSSKDKPISKGKGELVHGVREFSIDPSLV